MDLSSVGTRVAALRGAMQRHRIDAFVVPSSDPHLSEYLPGHWKGREWLTGFTGSAGLAIVLEIADQHQASVSVHSPAARDPQTGRDARRR